MPSFPYEFLFEKHLKSINQALNKAFKKAFKKDRNYPETFEKNRSHGEHNTVSKTTLLSLTVSPIFLYYDSFSFVQLQGKHCTKKASLKENPYEKSHF